jgi:hypothetical protein
MELFIPSLMVIVIGAIVFFVVLPKMAPYTLGGMAILLFILGMYQHYSTFPYEYSGNMKDLLRDYSGLVMLVVTILGFTVAIMLVYGGNPPPLSSLPMVSSMPSLPSLPSLPSPLGNSGAKRNNLASNSFRTT